LLVCLLAGAAAAGCSGSDAGPDPVTLEAIRVAPPVVTLAAGASQQFTATARFSDGGTAVASVTWSATGGTITESGEYTAGRAPGDYLVVATGQGVALADTASVTIPEPPPPNLIAIEVTPAAATVQSGLTQQFTAIGRLSDNSTTAVPVTWSATGGIVSAGGVYTAGAAPGSYRVIATEIGGPLADTATVTVTAAPPTLVAIEVTPATAALAPNGTQQFTAIGRMSDNGTQAVTVAWSATGGTISGAGLYTASATPGAFRVIAVLQGGTLADTSLVTITPPSIVAIRISPDSARLGPYGTQQFSAVGVLASGATTPVSVTWAATQATVPTFSGPPNSVTAGGLFTAGYPVGRFLVVAMQAGGTVADTVPVRVYNTTGQSVPLFVGDSLNFWTPEPGIVKLCTSNHFTDEPAGLGGTAVVTAAQGTLTTPIVYATRDSVQYADGSGAVKVECRPVWTAPSGLVGTVRVTIDVASNRPGSGMAKIFVYENRTNPQGRADYSKEQDFTPGMTTSAVSEFVDASLANGANIWFKSTIVP
jgi:hypothetical protein